MNFNLKQHKEDLLFLPLGGANEIGMNLNLYHLDGKWIMVDCGLGFAYNVPGIDMMTADISFIKANKKNLLAIIITHIHEDHLGAVQYLWQELEAPVYTSNLAANFLKSKLSEFNLEKKVPIRIIDNKKNLDLNPFNIEFIGLTHSVPEMKALIIKTKKGNILHTGDWKFDPDPVVGDVSQKEIIKSYGDKGEILAIVCDSTNALSKGHSGSEGELYESLKSIIQGRKGYVGVATFASNLARIHTIAKIAKELGRKIVLSGFSLHRLYEVAKKSGYFLEDYGFISDRELKSYQKHEILVICTGCQGEELASAKKIATHNHRFLKFTRGDLMIFSSKIIPGNEKKIFDLFGELSKKHIDVITEKDHFVHVSGHPNQDELREMYELAKPKLAIPVHGEFIHTKAHCELAVAGGVQKAIQVENGNVIKINCENVTQSSVIGHVQSGYLGVDGTQLINFNSPIIKERRKLQEAGIVTISMALDLNLELTSKIRINAVGCYDFQKDNSAKNMIEEEIRILLKQLVKKIKLPNKSGFGFLTSKKNQKNMQKIIENSVTSDIEKAVRGQVLRIFEDLTGKRPAVEIITHIIV